MSSETSELAIGSYETSVLDLESFTAGVAFDPSSLPLTGWWRDYAGAPWAGAASAGTSAAHALAAGATVPTVGALNGHGTADYISGENLVDGGYTLGSLFSAGAYTIAILAYVNTASAPGGNIYDVASWLVDTAGNASPGIGFSTSGVTVWHASGGVYDGPTVPQATGAWFLLQAKYDGTNLKLRINGGAWSSVAIGNVTAGLAANFKSGLSWDNVRAIDGRVAEMITSDVALSDANLDSYRTAYLNARYNLSL